MVLFDVICDVMLYSLIVLGDGATASRLTTWLRNADGGCARAPVADFSQSSGSCRCALIGVPCRLRMPLPLPLPLPLRLRLSLPLFVQS